MSAVANILAFQEHEVVPESGHISGEHVTEYGCGQILVIADLRLTPYLDQNLAIGHPPVTGSTIGQSANQ